MMTPMPRIGQFETPIASEGNWINAMKRKRKEWQSPGKKQDNAKSDIVKLRKRLVEAERARQDATAKLSAQMRATKLQKQNNEKLVTQSAMMKNDVEVLRQELQNAAQRYKYERNSRKMLEHRVKELEIENEAMKSNMTPY